jgi:hypothetical protein
MHDMHKIQVSDLDLDPQFFSSFPYDAIDERFSVIEVTCRQMAHAVGKARVLAQAHQHVGTVPDDNVKIDDDTASAHDVPPLKEGRAQW